MPAKHSQTRIETRIFWWTIFVPLVRSAARQSAKRGAGFGGSGIGGAKTGAAAKLSGGATSGRGSAKPGGADRAARPGGVEPGAGIGGVSVKLGSLGTGLADCRDCTPSGNPRGVRGFAFLEMATGG